MAVIDFVKWDAGADKLAWKFPSQQLSTWTQLVVAESQEAVLLDQGKLVAVFGPGRHVLDTKNIPGLTGLFAIPFGGQSPFTAEVWFVNRVMALDIKWGTPDPVFVLDPKYHVLLPVRAFGQLGIQIDNTKDFLIKLVGTAPEFDHEQFVSHFRGLLVTRIKDLIAKKIVRDAISVLEISAYLNDVSRDLHGQMASEFGEFGIKLVNFFVNSISTPEDDPSVVKLKTALAKRAEMDIVGFNYQQERAFDVMGEAAGNAGSGGNVMGAGIGMAMGMGIGNAMGAMAGGLGTQAKAVVAAVSCPECQGENPADNHFCVHCGKSMKVATKAPVPTGFTCDKCGQVAPNGARFCPECGDPYVACPGCGADNPSTAAVCAKCGIGFAVKCACGAEIPAAAKFCPTCGAKKP